MDIVKRLTLNKTPKDIPNGSIVCAKNIMVDDTGSFITNDIGFKESFSTEDKNEFIVGVIPCNKEIVIFTYNYTTEKSKIYRKPDVGQTVEVDCKWSYEGGKITGAYTYNYKGELIIAVAEYDSEFDSERKVPLKSFNLDTCDENYGQTYAIEETVPTYDTVVNIKQVGSLLCGVYTFFIRFKVDEYNFTKWFQISGDINITQEVSTKKYTHTYLDEGGNLINKNAGAAVVNNNKISDKAVELKIDFSDDTLPKCQIGYILKRNSDVVGRIQGEYDIVDRTIDVFVINNIFVCEVSVDDLLENPHQLYNVKNVINYNNRLYIANYEEYGVDDLTNEAKTVEISVKNSEDVSLSRPSENTISWNFSLDVYQHTFDSSGNTREPSDNKVNITNIVTDNNGYIISTQDKDRLLNTIAEVLWISWEFQSKIYWTDINNNTNLYWLIQKEGSNSKRDAICLKKHINITHSTDSELDSNDNPSGVSWDFNPKNYAIKLELGDNTNRPSIKVEYNGYSYNLINNKRDSVDTYDRSCLFAYYFNGVNRGYVIGGGIEYSTKQGANTVDTLKHSIHISDVNVRNDASINIDDDVPGEDGTISGGDTVSGGGPNIRTLHPYQSYNFFIHYIRIDGSYTPGFPIKEETLTYKLDAGKKVIYPSFKVSNPDSNKYVGYFISYEDVESTVDCIYIDSTVSGIKIIFTNAEFLYDVDTIRGDYLIIDGNKTQINKALLEYIENRLTFNHLEYNQGIAHTNKLAYVIKNINSIYNKKVKTLYRLTENIYCFDSYKASSYYLPAFYDRQVILEYMDTGTGNPKQIVADPSVEYVFELLGGIERHNDDGKKTVYTPNIILDDLYSIYPTSAMNIKEDFQLAALAITTGRGTDNETTNLYTNCIISPDKLHDFLEFRACYTAKPSKSFTNFNKDNVSIFDKTVYRSDIISDESLVNGFRHFNVTNYKTILENKGKITNIVGIGLYFLVHTEYSLFVFDRSPKLTVTAQTEIPDTFDINYQEVMSSNEGFGGLLDKEESIVTKNGYIWFDRTNSIIFRYENGKASILSIDINNYIKANNIHKVRFAEDIIHNRLIICFEVLIQGMPIYFTLSYSFYTNSFISAHDYKFTENYRTYGKSYIFDKSMSNKLYEFDDNSNANYLDLQYTDLYNFFPVYQTDSDYKVESYVDIIFNSSYELCNNLEYIRYVLNAIKSKNTLYNIVEEHLNRRYSGDRLKIYTDETDSGDLDIMVNEDDINNPNNYKLPHFEKGSWFLNYFRNKINVPVTDAEATRTTGHAVPTIVDKHVARSDNRSLIYGKYFVVRFIFDNYTKFKLDSLHIQVNAY